MFDFSFYELMVFGIIALIVLGPEKLPKAVRTAGTYYAKFRRTASTIKAEMEAELDLAETRQQMQKELEMIRQAEADMQKEMAQLRGNMQAIKEQQNSELNEIEKALATVENSDNSKSDSSDLNSLNLTSSDLDSSDLNSAKVSINQPQPSQTLSDPNPEYASDTSKAEVLPQPNPKQAATRPWENMWFLLGDYDKKRRLPPAPYLPNHKATPLLNADSSVASLTNRRQTDVGSEVSS